MQITTITAAYEPDHVVVAAAKTFDEAVRRINERLKRNYDRDHPGGAPWGYMEVPNNGSCIRSTAMGNIKFRVNEHEV